MFEHFLVSKCRKILPKHSVSQTIGSIQPLQSQSIIDNNKEPGRKVNTPDNKASHFFVAQYWAKALAEGDNAELAAKFAPVAKALVDNEAKIIEELLSIEGKPVEIGGYYHADDKLTEAAMRPSTTLNSIINNI